MKATSMIRALRFALPGLMLALPLSGAWANHVGDAPQRARQMVDNP